MPRISLCSFTYNDAALLHGLLATVPGWSVQPDEIILLDDGSATPFALTEVEQALPMPVRILWHESNQGFRLTKHDCISAATGDYILQLDCDARVTDDFLEACVEALQDKRVGMVGGVHAAPATDDYASWYAYAFSFSTEKGEQDDADTAKKVKAAEKAFPAAVAGKHESNFIAGPTAALRREVWEEIGGFSKYDKHILTDSYLSNTILEHGYILLTLKKPVRLMRVLTRAALCRRYWKWGCGYGWVESVIAAAQSLPPALGYLLNSMQSRCRSIAKEQLTPVFYYFEMLIFCHTMLEFCNALGPLGQIPINAGPSLLAALQRHLAAYPRLWMLLKSDLLLARTLPLKPAVAPAPGNLSPLATQCDWEPMLVFFKHFEEGNILRYLENEGVKLILQDDRETKTDFSAYESGEKV